MARQEFKYNPLDFEPDVAVGVTYPFNGSSLGRGDTQHYASGSISGNPGVFALSYSTEDQAISNLKTLILTKKGERFMQPDFGTTIVDSIFEQSTDELVRRIQDGLNDDIKYWLPYILVDNIIVKRIPDQHIVDVSLRFRVTEQGANQEIKIIVGDNGIELNNNIL